MPKKNYSRIFTALFPKRGINAFKKAKKRLFSLVGDRHTIGKKVSQFLLLYLFVVFIFLAYTVFVLFKTLNITVEERMREENRLSYWQAVIKRHPDFPDAYYEAAVSAAKLKEKEKALDLLQKALLLDPTFKEADIFQKQLEKEGD